jgi:tetratricopeptide (TPR) repeat protein
MKLLTQFLLIPFILNTVIAVGQNSVAASEKYKQAQKLIDLDPIAHVDSIRVLLYESALEEINHTNQDKIFVSKCLSVLADWYGYRPYNDEYIFNYYAWTFAIGARDISLSEEMLEKMRVVNEKIRKEDLPFNFSAHDTLKKVEMDMIYGINKVIRENKDTVWVEINAGKNEGVFKGSNGNVFSAYGGGWEDRGNKYLGKFFITSISNTKSVGYILKYNNKDTTGFYSIYPNDRIEVKGLAPIQTHKGVLFSLASNGVFLKNNYRDEIVGLAMIMGFEDEFTEREILKIMQQQVVSTANDMLESEETAKNFNDIIIPAGPHKNLNLLAAMQKTSVHDINAFLRFVNSYPAKYINQNYKINETYATWLINKSLSSSDVDAYYLETLLKIEDSLELITYFKQNEFYMLQDPEGESLNLEELGYTSLKTYKSKLHSNYLLDIYNSGRTEDAHKLFQKLLQVTAIWNNDTVKSNYYVQLGLIYEFEQKNDDALKLYDQIIKLNATAWLGYLYKAGLMNYHYNNQNSALLCYEKVNELAPWNTTAWVNRSDMLLKSGKYKLALETSKSAYDLNNYNSAAAVNLAHAYLLMGYDDSARIMYEKTLELITTTDEYIRGPKADFEYFIQNGVQVDKVKREFVFVEKEWEQKYSFIVKSQEIFETGKVANKEERFADADKLFNDAINTLKKAREVDYEWLRAYERWTAFNHYKAKDFTKSLEWYKKALEISTHQLKNKKSIISDMEDVATLYSWLDNTVAEKMIKHQIRMMKKADESKSENSTLYVMSIGVNQHFEGSYYTAEKDAAKMVEILKGGNKGLFKDVQSFLMVGKDATLKNFEKNMDQIILNIKSNDVLLFYYSGLSLKDRDFIKLAGNDSLIAAYFLGKMDFISASQKIIILDADKGKFTDLVLEEMNRKSESSIFFNDVMFLSPAHYRTENPLTAVSLFSKGLQDILLGEFSNFPETKKEITSNDIESSLFTYLKDNEGGNSLISYSYGQEFSLLSNPKFNPNLESKNEENQLSRGVIRINQNALNQSLLPTKNTQPKNYALLIGINEYDEFPKLNNPISDVNKVGNVLKTLYNFEVEIRENLTKDQFDEVILKYTSREYNKEDQLLIYIAGHGIEVKNRGGAIVCKDSKVSDPYQRTYMPYSELLRLKEHPTLNNILFVLDVCEGGTFFKHSIPIQPQNIVKTGYNDLAAFVSQNKTNPTYQFVTSSGKREAYDGLAGDNSPFAKGFIKILEEGGKSEHKILILNDFRKEIHVGNLKSDPQFGHIQTSVSKGLGEFIFQYTPIKTSSSKISF